MKTIPQSSKVPDNIEDFDLATIGFLRYSLFRHTYMVGAVQDFLRMHWNHPQIKRKHNIFLRDIKDGIGDMLFLYNEPSDGMDVQSWINFYNEIALYNKIIDKPLTAKDFERV